MLGALALLGVGAGAAVRFWAASRSGETAGGPSSASAFRPAVSPETAALWERLMRSLGQAGSGRFTIAGLVKLLRGHAADPAAAAFADEFRREPELAAIWSEYENSKDSLNAAWLLSRLSNSPRFIELFQRHSSNPDFRLVSESVERELSAEARGERNAPLEGRGPIAAAGARRGAGPGLVLASLAPSAPPAKANAPPGAPDAPRAAEPGEARPPRADWLPEDSKEITETRTGDEAHRVKKLSRLKAAGPSQDLNPWASLCYHEDPAISRAECAAINDRLGEDALWMACHKAGLLGKCVSLCQGKPELSCGPQATSLQRCLASHSAETCADACTKTPDCRVAPAFSESPANPSEGIDRDGEDGRWRCPGGNCDKCGCPGPWQNAGGCNRFCSEHPGDCGRC